MNLHTPALFTDDVLQAAASDIEGLSHQRVGISDAFPLNRERFELVTGETKLDANRVLVPVPMGDVDQCADPDQLASELLQPIGPLAHQPLEPR